MKRFVFVEVFDLVLGSNIVREVRILYNIDKKHRFATNVEVKKKKQKNKTPASLQDGNDIELTQLTQVN